MLLAKTKIITLHLSTACLLGLGFALSTWFRAKRKNMKILARKRTPSGREKGVRNWGWPFTGMQKYRVLKTTFCEGGRR